jgi:hypothetical protein
MAGVREGFTDAFNRIIDEIAKFQSPVVLPAPPVTTHN